MNMKSFYLPVSKGLFPQKHNVLILNSFNSIFNVNYFKGNLKFNVTRSKYCVLQAIMGGGLLTGYIMVSILVKHTHSTQK